MHKQGCGADEVLPRLELQTAPLVSKKLFVTTAYEKDGTCTRVDSEVLDSDSIFLAPRDATDVSKPLGTYLCDLS